MSGHKNQSHIPVLRRSSSPSSRHSDVNDSHHDALKPESKRSPVLKSSSSSAKFDKQVAILPMRFQAMTRIAAADTTESRSRRKLQRGVEIIDGERDEADSSDRGGSSADLQRSARKLSTNGDQKGAKSDGKPTYAEQPVGLVVVLFHDGFVCRHMTKENEGVEGFAQPYDAESSYFLACIDNGRVPEGLPDMIACAHYNGSVLTEIRDYREMRTALCPVSSAFLAPSSALLLTDSEVEAGCRIWHTLLLPGKIPLPLHAQFSPLLESPSLQSMFDHFPDVHPSELETLAMDAKRQLLQEDVLLSSSSTESSSPRDDSRAFGYFPAEPLEAHTNGDHDVSGSATTPTTRSRFHSRLETSPPASLLSPIQRKSTRPILNGQEDNTPKRCKRQIQTKVKGSKDNRKNEQKDCNLKDDSAMSFPRPHSDASGDHEMELCESPKYRRSGQSRRGYSELLAAETAQITPLPATQLFLSKLKGKRQRPDSNELLYGKPAWVTIAHVGRFFRAATRLEREHSRFLHANARRLMQADKAPPAETEHVAGSMRFLARQLGNMSRPSDVIAVACARELKAAEDEGRELCAPDWMDLEDHSPSSKWQAVVALVSPDNEPTLQLQRTAIAKDEDILLGQLFEVVTDTASLIKDYQPTSAAPHFNAFDDDGNLQLQSA
ncbi:hypothetical protein PC129_g436 [Phytophthora cactorum]|uniref:Spt20-like SEP domain-containing protein n=1 Tax=Phytophthora cactorum TaxID=29920 RepID=A0A329SWU1_9STRA|nr:hypothetical protein Pcac1_g3739 [Phytophthora cactorum]KAG2848127.1 hypothetical protein PC111_g546 [Phytophthora cactorum]KAG2868413.1 hypothetical protein PC113_g1102 [Phytophthora cactorum]KAG2943532.1 hypothetical protein PC115_g749 [Phytophthora cactorum]KAG2954749.1 hypothetical protein PC117_g957 [Phytophthora cactorum]